MTTSIYGDNLQGETEAVGVEDNRLIINSLGVSHHHVHDGHSYVSWYDTGAIANNATAELILQTGKKETHINFVGGGTGAFLVDTFQSPSFSAIGTPVVIMNRNRTSTHESVNALYSAPTLTADGTKLLSSMIPGGNNTGGSVPGQDFDRFVLKPLTYHMFRLTNISGNISRALLELGWYEPEPGYK